jgi:uncharacterized membrane protein HdeD (DUF308 family)
MATTAEAVTATAGVTPNRWWILLLEGIAAIAIGILLFTDTEQTVFTLVLFVGIWWFIGGMIDLITLFFDRTKWGWRLFSGILGIIAGLLIIRHPMWAAVLVPATLSWVIGFLGIVIGVMALIRAFTGEGWGAGIVGALSIVLGLFLFSTNVGVAMATAVVATAICAIVGGILAVVQAFRVRAV